MKIYGENNKGVHLMSALNAEYTLCGDAYDGGSEFEADGQTDVLDTNKRVVTCESCAIEIRNCRKTTINLDPKDLLK